MPDGHGVVRILTVYEFADGKYDTVIGELGRPVATRTPLRQIMAGTPEQVRETVEVFLALKENSDA